MNSFRSAALSHLLKQALAHSLMVGFFLLAASTVSAEVVTTSVTVGNSPPTFTAGPAESVASTATNPTNAGTAITFQATATDANGESYYLAICKTNSITPGSGGAAPTCAGGSWCISTLTSSGVQTTCNYTTQDADAETNAWYAFVCDDSSSSNCSSSSQGTGDSASPFEVNHRPAFTAISNDGPLDPGSDVTWTATASDSDTSGTSDTVKLLVCQTEGIANGECTGTEWCSSSLGPSNPTCNYSVPTPTTDQSYDAYAYVVDSHNFAASSAQQGSNSSYTVNNVAPVVSAVDLNSSADITLAAGTTTAVPITASVTDVNGCSTSEVTTVTASLYRSAITYAGCDSGGEDNDNNCYAVVTCTQNSCTGSSATYSCSIDVQYFADPTTASTQYAAQNWLTTVAATDDDAATHTEEVSSGVEMNSLTAMDITGSIAYGSLGPGQANDPLDKTTTITNLGNVGLDQDVTGSDMTSGGDTIDAEQQRYALASSTAYASGTQLTTSSVVVNTAIGKPTSLSSVTGNIWWGIEIPLGTPPGTYSGSTTMLAAMADVSDW